jgi:peptide/nickel transport system substrate-binding protein
MLNNRKDNLKRILFGVLLLFLGLLLVAVPCQAQQAPKGRAVIAASTPFGQTGGDAHTSTGGLGVQIASLINDTLWKVKKDGRVHPALAKSWQLAKDGRSIRIKLDERATFHNGAPVRSEDVKFSIERMQNPKLKFTQGSELRRHIDRVEILDNLNLIIHFKTSYPVVCDVFSVPYLAILPKAYIEKVGDEEFAKHPIGAGPFRWVDYKQDDYVEVEAVDNHYWQTPHVKSIRFVCVPEDATRMAMLRAGEADIAALPVRTFIEVKDDPNVKIVWSKFTHMDTLGFADLAFPKDRTPFFDVRVRRAASYAVNRKLICEKVLHGASEPWGDIYPPYMPGYDPKIPIPTYDPEKAKFLLKEAGYPNGIDTMISGPIHKAKQMEAVAADLARVGIRAKVNVLEYGIYSRQIYEKSLRGLALFYNPWYFGLTHPYPALRSCVSSATPWSYHTTPEADAAHSKLLTLIDEGDIAAQARNLSKVYRESEVRYMLWTNHMPFGLSKRVKYWEPNQAQIYVGGMEFLELTD